jgi:hypothetical protein
MQLHECSKETKNKSYVPFFAYLLFYVPLKNFSLIGDITITGEGLQNLGPCSALRAGMDLYLATPAVTRGIIYFSGLIRRTAPFSRLLRLAKGCGGPILIWILTGPHSVASCDTQGDAEDIFLPGFSNVLDNMSFPGFMDFFSFTKAYTSKLHKDTDTDRTVSYLLL